MWIFTIYHFVEDTVHFRLECNGDADLMHVTSHGKALKKHKVEHGLG